MPTQSTTYNSRVTDEALEKRFRDTFRAQGGAELVDDLYAQGVIVPIVDFTAAATGQQLSQNLQTAWDFSTGAAQINNANTQLVTTAGFWQVGLTCAVDTTNPSVNLEGRVYISDGTTTATIWAVSDFVRGSNDVALITNANFVAFLRSGDSLYCQSAFNTCTIDIWYRQIATVSGDLVNPSGFTSS